MATLNLNDLNSGGLQFAPYNGTPNPDAFITPYMSPSQGGSPNVPVGQTGLPYAQDFIGPVPVQTGTVGQPLSTVKTVVNNTPTQANQTPPPPGDSPLRALEKIGWDNMNPTQRSEYLKLLGEWQQSQVPQGPSDADINAIYDPLMRSLNDQASAYQAQLDPAKQALENQYSQGVSGLNTQATDAYNKLTNQQTQASTDQATAYAKARQLYNELSQRNQAMFGGRSSAGQFSGELLGRETAQQMGNTTNQSNAAKAAIEQERSRVGQWVSEQTNTWSQKKQEALDNLQNSFRAGLNQINAQKNSLESDKASRRLDLLNQAKQQAAQIQAADKAFAQQLALFQAQKESQLSAGSNQNLGQDVYSGNAISTAPMILGSTGVSTLGQQGTFGKSLRYVSAGNGMVQDKITGELIPESKFQG